MAVLSITAADVRPLNGSIIRRFKAGAAVTVGQAVYVDANGKVQAADGDDVDQAQARGIVVGVGIAGRTSAVADDQVDVVTHGPVYLGSVSMTPGGAVYVSPTAGSLDQTLSATTGDFNYILGFAEDDDTLYVQGEMTIPVAVS